MGEPDRNTRWVVVVPPEQQALYERLRQGLKPDAPFRIVLDRRQGERRRSDGAGPRGNRRRTDRRQTQPVGAVFVTAVAAATRAVRPVLPGTEIPVVTAACPSCSAMLSFELPRFPQPPARLDAEIVHPGGGGQHFAEIQAFTVSGRPLLVGRVHAFRREACS